MSIAIFGLGSALVVLGFSFRVLQVTNRLTEFRNKEAVMKTRMIGVMSILAGFFVAIVAIGMQPAERSLMVIAGFNIIALGLSTLVQAVLTAKNERALGAAAWGVLTVGFLMCIIYEIVTYF
jgi:hypothetical protein